MSDQFRPIFDAFPGAVVLLEQGNVTAANPMARHFLPQLQEGSPLPVTLPDIGQAQAGFFTTGLGTFTYQLSPAPQGQWLLFTPAPQTALTDQQLDGALRQLRSLLSQFVTIWEQDRQLDRSALRKTFYQTFRLLDNLDSLCLSAQDNLPFHPVPMDFAGLCRQVVDCAAPLLTQDGTSLILRSAPASLLIPGDPKLLQRLLLELISNAVRASQTEPGPISLSLSSQGTKAVLAVSHAGPAPSQRQIAAMLQQDSSQLLPQPGAGAGLGMAIARHIAALHRGSLLFTCGPSAPTVILSLPTTPMPSSLSIQSPKFQQDGGFSPLLVGLADVLPSSVFAVEDPI